MRYSPLVWTIALPLLVFGQPDRILFPHGFHVEEVGVACEDCHGDVAVSSNLTARLLPLMEDCLVCHDGDTASDDCGLCHADPDNAGSYTSAVTAGLLFPHITHTANDIPCATCHEGIEAAEAEVLIPRPGMGTCMDCHTTSLTDDGCLMCHATLEDKLPLSHAPDWIMVHGLHAPGSGEDTCAMCHQQTDCEDCHTRTQLEKRVHPPGYTFMHAGDFDVLAKDCATCHAMPRDCQACHAQNLVMPLDHNSTNWVFHPKSTYGVDSFHSQEAASHPEYCALCHQPAEDNTCLRCHG